MLLKLNTGDIVVYEWDGTCREIALVASKGCCNVLRFCNNCRFGLGLQNVANLTFSTENLQTFANLLVFWNKFPKNCKFYLTFGLGKRMHVGPRYVLINFWSRPRTELRFAFAAGQE